MIGRYRSDTDPSDPSAAPAEPNCVPLRLDDDSGHWVPIVEGDDPFLSELDAARVCAADLRERWIAIVRAARVLLALCEHPEFEFEFDGIDAEMVRESARGLQLLIYKCEEDVKRLLDHPGDRDSVRIADMVFRGDSETGYVRPANGHDGHDDPPPDAGMQ